MEITIVTPQFERVDDKVVIARPQGVEQFQALKRMSVSDLKALGCGVWTENEKCWHMLYPQEWYDCIPEGLDDQRPHRKVQTRCYRRRHSLWHVGLRLLGG